MVKDKVLRLATEKDNHPFTRQPQVHCDGEEDYHRKITNNTLDHAWALCSCKTKDNGHVQLQFPPNNVQVLKGFTFLIH